MSDSPAVSREKPEFWDEASTQLMGRDRILKKLIPRHRSEWLAPSASPFVTLARAIVGQQISIRSADAMWQRFTDACGRNPTPRAVMALAAEDIRLCGLSKRKSEYILDLATHFAEKKVKPAAWDAMDDEAVIADLCAIRGIGRWTAEMFLIFNLQRPDILPLDDASLLKAISLHYFSGEPVSRFEAREVAQAWAPWRTVATWYLWRSLDPASVQY
ncbi:DNA-3-methyladenine glycosylase family protein [Pollutimonas thiosulfatoxidans]|uniref:DNA-3-methyladenine glycosylase II n=1 Tax=Pollutimonas thiosulfatoxidans TaxID=2028345 RepID=A0A410GC69_9BURK|nr:DNA-3-methyladenine glycosylase [Pollutimonas thiosulfatoxidans]MBF6618027.1 DNA-3-methyladenine glycosylase 2 family protein [Candidimonas sp.]NYT44529.1 DNA-3-methyladenine glycosylase 2 family protein [Alcaligenaceae bacterium]QAA93883.1 DNA-3-methyladenine glycosylase [Pollutimonas thiosulfatoxidans]